MPAAETRRLKPSTLKPGATLGVLAGGGSLPAVLLAACAAQSIPVFIVAFPGHADPALYAGQPHIVTRPGRAGAIIRALKSRGIADLVWIGSLHRPSFLELRPDWRAAKFYAGVAVRALGDDGLLRAIRKELEADGFTLHGIQDFVAGIAGPPGDLGGLSPLAADEPGIRRGLEVSQTLGRLDIGQSVVIKDGVVVGVEGVEGTDALIERCGRYMPEGGCILIKTCKPDQDRDLDLPTIGLKTLGLAAQWRFKGIIFQAGQTLFADAAGLAREADRLGLFVTGVEIDGVEIDHA